jgi:hypothetical protein
VAGAGVGELLLDELKRSACGGNLHGTARDCGHSSVFSSAFGWEPRVEVAEE